MSDTSVVFNVIGKERVGGTLNRVRAMFRSAGQEAERATSKAAQSTERLDREIHDVEESLARLNAEFAATGNKELFAKMKRDRSLLSQLKAVRRELGGVEDAADQAGRAAEEAGRGFRDHLSTALQNAGTAVTNLTTNLWNWIPALSAAASGLAALGPAASLAGGAIGALPGLISGAAGAFAAFQMGVGGLSSEYQRLADAQKALNAPSGGGGGGSPITKLAPAAREFLKVLIGLRPAFERLRLGVQQRMFAGIGDILKTVAMAWLPTLTRRLGGFADTFNSIFKNLGRSLTKSSFIADISSAMEYFRGAFERVGQAITGPLVSAFGTLARAAGPFIYELGRQVAGLVEDFSAWIDQADRSGKLTKFFADAAFYLGEVFSIGREAARVVVNFLDAAFGGKDGELAAKSGIVGVRLAMKDVADWLGDPENKKKVQDFMADVVEAAKSVGQAIDDVTAAIKTVQGWWNTLRNFKNRAVAAFDELGRKWSATAGWLSEKAHQLVGVFQSLPSRIGKATSGMFDGLRTSFRSALNWIIGKWNGLSFGINGFSFAGITVPGISVGTPHIPYLDTGGDVLRDGLAVIHKGERVTPAAEVAKLGTLGGGVTRVEVSAAPGIGEAFVRALLPYLRYDIRTQGGGSVQKHLGVKGVA